jgi:site-specific DNA recombinase
MKTAIYLRQSLDRDRTELAIDRQRDACLKLCRTNGWTDTVEYVDNNTSATKGRRPEYQQMLADIRSGAIDAVVAYDADRLQRQPLELEEFIILCTEKHNVNMATVGGDFDLSTEQGQYYARLEAARSRREIQRKSARQKAANRQRAHAGKPWVSRPFGYTMKVDREKAEAKGKTWDPVTDATDNEIVAHEAAAIRKACRALLKGATLYSIAQEWNSAGLRTSKGCTWTGGTVKQVLIRPRNAGLQVYDGEVLDGVKPAWPAIVKRDVFDAVCVVLGDPKRHTGRSTGRKHLLPGIAICGVCNRPIGTAVRKLKSGGNRPVYQCKRMGCMKIVRDLAETDKLVIDIITATLADPKWAAALAKRPTVDTAELSAQADALHTLIAETREEYEEGLINARDRNARLDRLNEKLAAVNAKLLPAHMSPDLKDLAGKPDAAKRFAALPTLDRRRAVIDVMAVVTIHPQEKQGGRFDHRAITVVGKPM